MTMQITIKPIPKALFHTLGKQPLSIYQAFWIELMLSFTFLLLLEEYGLTRADLALEK